MDHHLEAEPPRKEGREVQAQGVAPERPLPGAGPGPWRDYPLVFEPAAPHRPAPLAEVSLGTHAGAECAEPDAAGEPDDADEPGPVRSAELWEAARRLPWSDRPWRKSLRPLSRALARDEVILACQRVAITLSAHLTVVITDRYVHLSPSAITFAWLALREGTPEQFCHGRDRIQHSPHPERDAHRLGAEAMAHRVG